MKRMKKCADLVCGKADQEISNEVVVSAEWNGRAGEQHFMEDASTFTRICPEEVWLLILMKLKKKDLANCVNSSPFIWKLRINNRTLDLIHNVVGIMAPLFEENNVSADFTDVEKNIIKAQNKQSGIIERRNGKSDAVDKGAKLSAAIHVDWMSLILKCRLIYLAWNKAVEECYEKAEMTGIQEFVDEVDPRSRLRTICVKWTNQMICSVTHDNHPQRFVEYFEKSHGSESETSSKNPFIGRRVFLRITQDSNINERRREYNSFVKMLRLFGDQIWYCNLYVAFRFSNPAQIASKLQQILKLLPNLKYLSVNAAGIPSYPLNMFTRSPLPKLEKLEVLDLIWLGSSIASELIRRNSHVEFLTISRSDVDSNVGVLLTNLKGYSTRYSVGGDEILACFGNNWQIKKVAIEQTRETGAIQLFQSLHYWADTLTYSYLDDPFSRDENSTLTQSKNLRLELPNVRRLSIRSFFPFFMDFVLSLNNVLEHLEVYVHARWNKGHNDWIKVKKQQTIELVGFRENLFINRDLFIYKFRDIFVNYFLLSKLIGLEKCTMGAFLNSDY